MSTATETKSHKSAKHVESFERMITNAKSAQADVLNEGFYEELWKYIHQPWWTTPAEILFFELSIEELRAQMQRVATLQKQILAASQAVGRE